jgi:hypothetical protein
MRVFASLAFAALLAAAMPATAGTITEDISVTGSAGNGPSFVTGSLFNPALGTLTGVSANINGTFSADVFIPAPAPRQFTAALDGTLTAPNQIVSGNLGDFILTANNPAGGGNYTGFERFNVNVNLTSLADYVAGSPNATNFLAEIGLSDRVISGNIGASSDFSTYAFNFDLTYTYEVPEPSTLLLMGLATCVLLGGVTLGLRPKFASEKKAVLF